MEHRSERREALRRASKPSVVVTISGVSDEDEPEEVIAGKFTTPDPVDGHVHIIPDWAVDDKGNGSTAPEKAEGDDVPHVHPIVKGKIVEFVRGDYVSSHKGIKEDDKDSERADV